MIPLKNENKNGLPGFEVRNFHSRIAAIDNEIMSLLAYMEDSRDNVLSEVAEKIHKLNSNLEMHHIEEKKQNIRKSIKKIKVATGGSSGYGGDNVLSNRKKKRELKRIKKQYKKILEALDELEISIGINIAKETDNLMQKITDAEYFIVEAEKKGLKIFSSLGDLVMLKKKVSNLKLEAVRVSTFIHKLRLGITRSPNGWFNNYKVKAEIKRWRELEIYSHAPNHVIG